MALFTVTNLNDSGAGSLRQAIIDANANSDADTIEFAAGITGGTTAGVDDGIIVLSSGELLISNDVTIDGDVDDDGVADITIDANDMSRVMVIFSPGGSIVDEGETASAPLAARDRPDRPEDVLTRGVINEVTLDGLHMTGGYDSTSIGGALVSFATKLNIYNSSVTDSESLGKGGGIYALNATLVNTSILDNTAVTGGGGVYLGGTTAALENVTIAGNAVTGIAYGGGLASLAAVNTISNSTVSQNTATNGAGGGMHFFHPQFGPRYDLDINNSTIFANTADRGGGIYLLAGVDAVVNNTILAGNTAGVTMPNFGNDLARGTLGGVAPTAFFYSSMISTDTVVNNLDPNTFTNNTPALGPLADNGGLVHTHALLAGSLAISAGDASLLPQDIFDLDGDGDTSEAVPLDAKGDARVIGTLDIGAVEFVAPALTVTLRNTSDVAVGTFATIAEAVAAAGDFFTIEVAPGYAAGPETVTTVNNGLAFDMPAGETVNVSFADLAATTLRSTGEGPVSFTGNTANNIFVSGAGADTFVGGAGDDMVMYSTSDARVEVALGLGTADSGHATGDSLNGIEDLFGSEFNDLLRGNGNDNSINGWQGGDNINGLGGDDDLSGEGGNDLISGANGNDTIFGGADNDTLRGNAGEDSILGGLGLDEVFGGIGNDFVNGGGDNDSVLGQGNSDTILGDAGNDTLRGGSGNDSIEGGDNDDELFGNGNNDTLRGEDGNDLLQGAAGIDRLFGHAGNDTLSGGDGGDRLDGGIGDDVMNGGTNDGVRDVFVFLVGYDQDRINAFDQIGTDQIELDEDLWAATPGLTKQQVIDTFGTLSVNDTILTLDFGGGDVLEVQNAGGIDQATLGTDVAFV